MRAGAALAEPELGTQRLAAVRPLELERTGPRQGADKHQRRQRAEQLLWMLHK
jgi:hypothetical protein